MSSLEEKIEQRKKQAMGRRIYDKAQTIAQYLGNPQSFDDRAGTSGTNYVFADAETKLNIKYEEGEFRSESGWKTVVIEYKGNKKFEKTWDVNCYIPGPWEKTLNQIYRRALIAKVQHEKDQDKNTLLKTKEAEKELAKKFGL